jgi:3-oxoacyl-[acyl-carrier-protein] synthase-3
MRFAAVSMAVPERIQTAEELAPLLGRSADWIEQHTGVLRRRMADDGLSPAQLAAIAAQDVVSKVGPPDLILYAGALPQQLVPDTSVFLHRELCLERVPSFTVNQTCLSFVAALQVANGLLKARCYRRILICSAELATRGRCFEEAESAALLGDGAAAAIVEHVDDSYSELLHSELETWSTGLDLCFVRAGNHPAPTPDMTHSDLYHFHMQGPQLYRFVRPRLRQFLSGFLERAMCPLDEIKLIVPHQASGPGLRLLEQFGFASDRIVSIVADYGNCVAASIPMALAVALRSRRLVRGDKVLLVGTAAGISLGAALIRW